MKKAGIIGGSGFIGSYNTKKFLEEGYAVRVSATDLSKKEKYDHLWQLPNADHLEIVQLNVEDKAALLEFLAGCSIVIHGGTPFQLDVKDPQVELFDPTVKGTINFLEAVQQTPGIEKVVIVASVASYNAGFPMPPAGKVPGEQFTEADEPFMHETHHPYGQAKFMANQTVNRFIADHPELEFEIVSVSPVMVIGKSLSARQDATSTGIQFLFKNKIAPNPFIQMLYDTDAEFALVDVSDVAEAIFKAAITPGNNGKNYLLSSESYKVSDIHLMLNNLSPVNPPHIFYSNALAKKELGMNFNKASIPLGQY